MPDTRSPVCEYRFGDYRVRTDDLTLRFRDVELPLAPKVVKTLIVLLDRQGEVVSKDELLRLVWGDTAVEEANLSQNIYSLRRQFNAMSGEPIVETLPRRGYAIKAAVERRMIGPRASGDAVVRSPHTWLAAAFVAVAAGFAVIASGYPAGPPDLPADAQRAYDLGWYYWRGATPTGMRTSIGYFNRVIRAVPDSPLGYAADAVAYAKLSDLESSAAAVADADTADRYAAQAIALDGRSGMALAARGFVEWDLESDNDGAARDLAAAAAIDPANEFARMWYGDLLLWKGDVGGSRRELEAAANIDPTLPGLDYTLGLDFYFGRDYADSAAYAKVAVDDPWSSEPARLLLAAAYEEGGRYQQAIGALRPLSSSISTKIAVYGTLAHIYASMGEPARALGALSVVEQLSTRYEGRPVLTALAYAANGQPDQAFAWLSRLPRADRAAFALDPRLDSLRRDKRFDHWLHG